MKKNLLLFCLFWIAFSRNCFAQIPADHSVARLMPLRNSVYAELGGNGIIGSLNYERLFPVSENFAFVFRAGGLYLPDRGKNYGYMLPAEISLLVGRNNLKFETGFGYTYFKYVDQQYRDNTGNPGAPGKMLPILRIGARRQLGESPFFFRSAFTFIFIESVTLGKFPIPWIGLSAGYNFGRK